LSVVLGLGFMYACLCQVERVFANNRLGKELCLQALVCQNTLQLAF